MLAPGITTIFIIKDYLETETRLLKKMIFIDRISLEINFETRRFL